MKIEEGTKTIIGIYANDIYAHLNDLISDYISKDEAEELKEKINNKLVELLAILSDL